MSEKGGVVAVGADDGVVGGVILYSDGAFGHSFAGKTHAEVKGMGV